MISVDSCWGRSVIADIGLAEAYRPKLWLVFVNYFDNLVRRQILSEPNARRVAFWVEPMIDSLVDECVGRDKPLLVAVAGAPASGKSIAMYHTQERLRERGVSMVSLSLDELFDR